MKTLMTTISAEYVKDWGVREGIREILQNAIDAEKDGSKMEVWYHAKEETLEVISRGAKLSLSDFLMGSTTKRGDSSSIGKFGEGYKIGSLALVRDGKKVSIFNQQEGTVFYVKIAKDDQYKANVLAFDLETNVHFGEDLVFRIEGLTNEEWVNQRNYYIGNLETEKLQTEKGFILKDKKYSGSIFCNGLFVGNTEDLKYGYDMKPEYIKLDRDRCVIDWHSTRWNTASMWNTLIKYETKDILSMLIEEKKDVEFIRYFASKEDIEILSNEFTKDNNSFYPVYSDGERSRIEKCGYTPVTVNYTTCQTLRESMGDITDIEHQVRFNCDIVAMKEDWSDNIQWSLHQLQNIDTSFNPSYSSVDFINNITRSTVIDNNMLVSTTVLGSRIDTLEEIINCYAELSDLDVIEVWKKLYEINVRD